MVKGCRIDAGPCKKATSKMHPPKTLGTRVSCETGTRPGGQRGIGLDKYRRRDGIELGRV